jgi:hypothetical protein
MAEATTRPVGENTGEAPTWSDAHDEHDRHGRPTGARWVRCRDCGVEVLVRDRDTATHRAGCSA